MVRDPRPVDEIRAELDALWAEHKDLTLNQVPAQERVVKESRATLDALYSRRRQVEERIGRLRPRLYGRG